MEPEVTSERPAAGGKHEQLARLIEGLRAQEQDPGDSVGSVN